LASSVKPELTPRQPAHADVEIASGATAFEMRCRLARRGPSEARYCEHGLPAALLEIADGLWP
jgi:hypothetical protein